MPIINPVEFSNPIAALKAVRTIRRECGATPLILSESLSRDVDMVKAIMRLGVTYYKLEQNIPTE